jgi:CubicO group peptidase (beta-lactamase class C family)
MKKLLLLFSFIASFHLVKSQIDPVLATQLQNVLNAEVATGGSHGVSAHLILQSGQTWSGTAGVNGAGLPITDTTVFHGASLTKLNVAILMLLLQENGVLSLDDSWHMYLPSLNVGFDTTITIRQLLNHTSGIAEYLDPGHWTTYVTPNFSTFYTPQYILENIVSDVPDFAPGTNFNYSSSNYVLAALVAEAVTGNPVQAELRTRIWTPLQMNHTYFGAYDSIPDPRAGVWWNFGSGLTDYSNQPTTSMLSYGYGGANIVSCPTDLATLVHALHDNLVLSPQSMNEMQAFVPQSFTNWWTAGYGLGLHHLYAQQVDTLLGHDGDYTNLADVFHSNMCGFTLATMTNTETLWQGIYNSMYDVLRNYYQCNAVPVANFHASVRTTCTGTTITFSDSSSNIRPTSWNWSFPGGTLTGGTSVTDSMPQVFYTTPGVYAVSYTASASAGSDSITKNGYITIHSNVSSYTSFVEGFETATLPNTDWSLANSGGEDWAVTSLGAANGSQSAYIDNFSNAGGNKSVLTGPVLDISGMATPRLSFKMAYQQKTAANSDKLQLLTSTNCGATWTARWTRSGSSLATVTPPGATPLAPAASQFTTYTVSLAGVAGSTNMRFKFEFTAGAAGPGNNIFVDDINISDAAVGIPASQSQLSLELFPNPSQDAVTLGFSLAEKKNVSVLITDVTGRIVESIPSREYATGLSKIRIAEKNAYEAGIYFVNVSVDGTVLSKKLIIQ